MAKVNVFHDPVGNTLVVWFGDSREEVEVEETGDEVLLMKNKEGKVIGFEKLNFLSQSEKSVRIAFETFAA
ncbi:MAG: DUF2283 domain-containing protein [Phormidesmis sp.]